MPRTHEADTPSTTHLRQLAVRHAVRYEVLPEMQIFEGRRVCLGFDLQLYALHEHPEGVTPGCPECTKAYTALRAIADWMLPREQRPSRYEINDFRPALYQAPDLPTREEVRLDVRIVHRHDFFSPVDPCEERCLNEMKGNLALLGIKEGARRPSAGP